MDYFSVTAETVTFDPALRRSWQKGGEWPHASLYHFYEAVVAAYFVLRGYHVIRDYVATRQSGARPVTSYSTQLFHNVIGPEASEYFLDNVDKVAPAGSGQPDLFVFREEAPNDPKVRYADPRLWFFVEVKGPGDTVRENQKAFWRAVARRSDIGLGPDRVRLFQTIPEGTVCADTVIRY